MIQRNPHPVFSVLWGLWALATIYFFVIGVDTTQWIVWASFFLVIELVGVFYTSPSDERDTLSETMTWVQRHFSKHMKFGRGWNAAILAFVLMVAWVAMAPVENESHGTVIGILIAMWLYDHWMEPDVHG